MLHQPDMKAADGLIEQLSAALGLAKIVIVGIKEDGAYLGHYHCSPVDALGLFHYGRITAEIEVKDQVLANRTIRNGAKTAEDILKKAFGISVSSKVKPLGKYTIPKTKKISSGKKGGG